MSRRNTDDTLIGLLVLAFVLCMVIGCVGSALDSCSSDADRRDCRRRGGQVMIDDDHPDNWHCVGAQAERAP